MSIFMTFRIAVKALNRNKLRTTLTMLGMIIGVGAVITMVALGNGARVSIEQQIQSAGTNVIMINAGNFTAGGVRGGQGMSNTLTPEDAAAVREVPGVQYLGGNGQEPRRAGRRGQPELEHQHRGHERRPAADQVVADRIGHVPHGDGCRQQREGVRDRHHGQEHALPDGTIRSARSSASASTRSRSSAC